MTVRSRNRQLNYLKNLEKEEYSKLTIMKLLKTMKLRCKRNRNHYQQRV